MTLANRNQQGQGDLVRPKDGVSVSRRTAQKGLPIIRVVQDQSKGDNATPGMFRWVSTGEEFEVLEGVPLAIREGRTLWPIPFKGDGSPPVCWSTDSVTADPGAMYAGRFCDDCEFIFDGCSSKYDVLWMLLPERKEVLLQFTAGMGEWVGALIQADAVRAKHTRSRTIKTRNRQGNWYTLKLDNDMPDLPPVQMMEIERYYRARYAAGAGVALQPEPSVDSEAHELLGDESELTLPDPASMDDMTQTPAARRDVDPVTGEIIDMENVNNQPSELPPDYYNQSDDESRAQSSNDDDYDDLPF